MSLLTWTMIDGTALATGVQPSVSAFTLATLSTRVLGL